MACPIFAGKHFYRDLIGDCFGLLGEIEVVYFPVLETSAPFRATTGVHSHAGAHGNPA